MKNVSIVLGLGYGDEGKGLTTDYLCSQAKNPIVIRFSGGQQAGHTVMVDDKKHIHSNFGAGTLRGVPSYFSEHTTIYPTTILREMKVLEDKGITPKLTIHPLAKITTPYDVYANRNDSDNCNHGTCGLGVGKTMKRNESPFKLYAIDLLNPTIFHKKINQIKDLYYKEHWFSGENFINDMVDFCAAIEDIEWDIQNYNYLYKFNDWIFEGSQGILLDMDHGVFPHVTYSNTTSKNVWSILKNFDWDDYKTPKIYYITRAYSTRHGNGPFIEEEINLVNNEEETNVNNKWQKEFKIANIKYKDLIYAIDVDNIYSGRKGLKTLVVTCLDQMPEGFEFKYSKLSHKVNEILISNSPYSNLQNLDI
jgi:adenylosuccinate synthase